MHILTNLPMKNTYNTVKASDINNLLAKSEKKENELVIPTFLQSRMKKQGGSPIFPFSNLL